MQIFLLLFGLICSISNTNICCTFIDRGLDARLVRLQICFHNSLRRAIGPKSTSSFIPIFYLRGGKREPDDAAEHTSFSNSKRKSVRSKSAVRDESDLEKMTDESESSSGKEAESFESSFVEKSSKRPSDDDDFIPATERGSARKSSKGDLTRSADSAENTDTHDVEGSGEESKAEGSSSVDDNESAPSDDRVEGKPPFFTGARVRPPYTSQQRSARNETPTARTQHGLHAAFAAGVARSRCRRSARSKTLTGNAIENDNSD